MSKDALIFISEYSDIEGWRRELNRLIPEVEFRVWPETGNNADVKAALVWKPPHGSLLQFPNLKIVTNLGVGVDHLLQDKSLPPNAIIARVVDPSLTARMVEYVVMQVLTLHRRVPDLRQAQSAAEWRFIRPEDPSSVCVGVLGVGNIGQNALQALGRFGFRLAGWSRSPKKLEGISCFAGAQEMPKFLASCDIVVSLLPLTPDTENLIDAKVFGQMTKGSAFISLGRGATVVDDDLLAALDSGQLRHAILDVFRAEPLPSSHPFWRHPKITITPHNSGATSPRTAAPGVAEDIRRAIAGAPVHARVDRVRGY